MNEHDQTTDEAAEGAEVSVVKISVHAEPAHPRGAGAQLVDEALETADVPPGTPVSIAVPAGDAEMVGRCYDLLGDEAAHRAGSTTIVEGVVHADPARGIESEAPR